MSAYQYREQHRFTAPARPCVGGPVSPERADELRASWSAAFEQWAATATTEQLEEWAETFAPDHPEWFEQEPNHVG